MEKSCSLSSGEYFSTPILLQFLISGLFLLSAYSSLSSAVEGERGRSLLPSARRRTPDRLERTDLMDVSDSASDAALPLGAAGADPVAEVPVAVFKANCLAGAACPAAELDAC